MKKTAKSQVKRLSGPAGLLAPLFLLLISGCGSKTPVVLTETAVPPAAVDVQAVESLPATAAALPVPTVDEARQTVQNFLAALQLDANSSLAPQLLAPALIEKAAGGDSLQVALLNSSEPIPAFEVSAARLSPDGGSASMEATIFFQIPINMNFSLTTVDGLWKIAEIKPSAGEYPSTPEDVVQAFLIAYQERPDSMSSYLTAGRRDNQPPGGSVGMLQILGPLEGVLVKSAVVNPAEPPQAVIEVTIKAGGIETTRQFILVMENDHWGIDRIMNGQ